MVTLKQLSKELGVSVSTVSKALNDSFEIGKETKKRVVALAKKYNYTPNTTAVNLRAKSTKTVGVIIPNIFNHFYTKILAGIEKEAKKNNYKIVVSISNEQIANEKEGISFFSNGSVDGVLLAPSEETEKEGSFDHIHELKNREIPHVLFDRNTDAITSDKVIVDDFEAAKSTINYFNSLHKKKILVVSLLKNLSIGKQRKDGALAANKNITILEFETEEELVPELEKIVKTQKFDAVFTLDELSGIISLNTLRTLKYSIPKEISIISFSQGILSQYSYPKLSTINQHAEEIGATSFQLLLDRIQQKTVTNFKTTVIKTTLEINQT